jgi:hypothetical protein
MNGQTKISIFLAAFMRSSHLNALAPGIDGIDQMILYDSE